MVEYADESVFPQPIDRLWTLLRAHLDAGTIGQIRSQRTVQQVDGETTLLERGIDVRGKLMTSTWKVTYRPPGFSRWEVVASEGPWATGSFMENQYAPEGTGTRLRSRGELKISVLPFFLPQRSTIRKVFETIDTEDQAFLRE